MKNYGSLEFQAYVDEALCKIAGWYSAYDRQDKGKVYRHVDCQRYFTRSLKRIHDDKCR